MEGIVFSNLNEIVKNKEVISETQTHDVWGIMPFETAEVQGLGVVTTDVGLPAPLVLSPKLTGWHKVYIGAIDMSGEIMLQVKLDNEDAYTMLSNSRGKATPKSWTQTEMVREMFFTCADLTDRELIIRKNKHYPRITCIVWIRCVPMTEAEIEAYKAYVDPSVKRNLHVHYDNAFDYRHGVDSEEDAILRYLPLRNSHAKICSQEILNDVVDPEVFSDQCRILSSRHQNLACVKDVKISEKMDWLVKTRADYLHSIGVQFYAAFRMSLANVGTPWAPYARYAFVTEHPEYYMKTRDGRTVTVCSYAYPEVRRFVIEYFKRAVARGYDGVSLITHRGMHLAFEQPVLDEFARRYDGLDARRVPMDDPRLKDLWGEYMTQFVRELRTELDATFGRHVPINVITGHTPEVSRRVGIDIEALCKEGLIDHFCAETMSTYEDLTDCLADDGLIDLEKYKEQLGKRHVVARCFGYDRVGVEEGTPQFAAIAEKYGVEFFAGMNPSARTAPEFVEWIEMQKKCGAKCISFFNYLEYTQSIEIMTAASRTAHDTIDPSYYTPNFYRLMSFDGCDWSTYLQNWRC